MANQEWYYADVDNQDVGPVSRADFKKAYKSGRVSDACQCWTSTMGDWAPIGSLPELLSFLKASDKPPGPPGGKRPSSAGSPSGSPRKSIMEQAAPPPPEEAKEAVSVRPQSQGPRPGAPGGRKASSGGSAAPSSGPAAAATANSRPISLNGLMPLPNLDAMSPDEIALAFYQSEYHYVNDCLKVLMQDFRDRLDTHSMVGQDVLTKEQFMLEKVGMGIFPKDLKSLCDLHEKLLQFMKSRMIEDVAKGGGGALRDNIGAIMNMVVPFFGLYTDLVKNIKSRHLSKLEEIKAGNANGFQTWLEVNEFVTGMQFRQMLEAPMERLPQYLMFCGKLYQKQAVEAQGKRTVPLQSLSEAVRGIQQVTDKISQTIMDQQRRDQLLEVQMENFKNSVDLVTASRKCFRIGNVKLHEVKGKGKYGKPKPHVFVLCNDCVLWGTGDVGNLSRGEKMKPGKPVMAAPLGNMVVADEEDQPSVFKNGFRIRCENTKSEWIVRVASSKEKRLWLADFQAAFDEFTESLNAATGGGEAAKELAANFEKKVMKKKYKPQAQPKPNAPVLLDIQGNPFGTKPATAAAGGRPAGSPAGGSRRPQGGRPTSPRGGATGRPAGRPGLPNKGPAGGGDSGMPPPPPPGGDEEELLPPPGDEEELLPPPEEDVSGGDGDEDANYPWAKLYDDDSGQYYYEHQETGESSWEPPAGWKTPGESSSGAISLGGGGGGGMLSAPISLGGGGAAASSGPISIGSSGGGLLGQISQGFQLKSNDRRQPSRVIEEEPAAPDIGEQLTESLANYRKFVVGDEEDESDAEDDWD